MLIKGTTPYQMLTLSSPYIFHVLNPLSGRKGLYTVLLALYEVWSTLYQGGAPAWRPASVAEPGQGPVLGLLSSEQRQLQGRLAPALRPALQERAGAWPASHCAPGWLLAGWLAPHPGSTTSVSWLAGWPLQLATEIFPENICWEFWDGGGGGVEV